MRLRHAASIALIACSALVAGACANSPTEPLAAPVARHDCIRQDSVQTLNAGQNTLGSGTETCGTGGFGSGT